MNVSSATTTQTDLLQVGGALGLDLAGNGFTVGVWDGGSVLDTHEELFGRVILDNPAANVSAHATHIAGTIAASGVSAPLQGMATAVQLRSWDWTNDLVEMGQNFGQLDAANHSYGGTSGWYVDDGTDFQMGNMDVWRGFYDVDLNAGEDQQFGKYTQATHDLDAVLNANPNCLSVWAAANDRDDVFTAANGNGQFIARLANGQFWLLNAAQDQVPVGDGTADNGYDTVMRDAVAKNNLVVGAVDDGAAMAAFSSWGPTDDGRIKPDVVGNGVDVQSAHSAHNAAWATGNGTSQAAPNVTGTAVLLMEHFDNLFGTRPLAATTKGLLIHTADDLGNTGPDYQFGWGLVDAAAAANHLTDAAAAEASTWVSEETYTGQEWTMNVFSDGIDPLKASIVWADLAGVPQAAGLDVATSVLVNDLDLWITGPDGTHLPWTLDWANPATPAVRTAENHLDNVEQVLIDTPDSGVYTIHIGHTGGAFTQDFSVLVSGLTPPGTNIAGDSFEVDADYGWADEWAFTGNARSGNWASWSHSPTWSLVVPAVATATRTVDLSNVTNAVMTLWTRARSFDTVAEEACIEVNDGSGWDPVVTVVKADTSWIERTVDLSPYAMTSDFQVRVAAYMGGAQDWVYVDDITITGNLTTGEPTSLTLLSDTGRSPTDNVTNANNALQFEVDGAIADALVELYVQLPGDDLLLDAAITTGGTIPLATDVDLADFGDGTHTFYVCQTLPFQLPSTTETLDVTIDTQAPTVDMPDLHFNFDTGQEDDDDITQGVNPRFDGTASDAVSGLWKVVVTSDDSKTNTDEVDPANYLVVLPTLGESATDGRTVTATAHDVAGNTAVSSTLSMTIDRTKPEAIGNPVINNGASQRHMIEVVAYAFDEKVVIEVSDLLLYYYDVTGWTGPQTLTGIGLTYDAVDNIATWSDINHPSAIAIANQRGDYAIQMDFDSVTDVAGNTLVYDSNDDEEEDVFQFHVLAGDINGNRIQDSTDIDLLFNREANSDVDFDIDGDGLITDADMDLLILTIMDTFYGDMDLDGDVDLDDFVTLKQNYDITPASWATGDMDGDGDVDLDDFVLLKQYFGSDHDEPNRGDQLLPLDSLGAIPVWVKPV